MIKLYDVGDKYKEARENLELMLEQGVVDQQTVDDTLEGLKSDDNEALVAWVKYLDELDEFVDVLKNKKRKLSDEITKHENLALKIKLKVMDYMAETGQKSIIEDITVKLKGKATGVVVTDKTLVPEDYYKVVERKSKELDKSLCKAVLEQGGSINGLRLTKTRLEIV